MKKKTKEPKPKKIKEPKGSLVIVESPTKAKTIGKILGKAFPVVSCMGHVIDLPQKTLGVDVEKNFEPEYVVIYGRQKVLDVIKAEGKDKAVIYVATDPDREGEAIGWQIKDKLFKNKKVMRVVFHEITTAAINEAFKNPRHFDENMIEAQAGRRILDRLVGYFLSPLLWKKITRGLSAGRVQSVALKLIVDRERQIEKFIPKEYWEVEAELSKAQGSQDSPSFIAKLDKIDDTKAEVKNKEEADSIVVNIKDRQFTVAGIKNTEKKRYPSAPFITSTLQQEAFNKLRYNATKTMIIAQQLYEGIDIGNEAVTGLITYMRTDSPRVAPEAIKEARSYIAKNFGERYLPEAPNVYKVRKTAQEAHEAIRPTLITESPKALEQFLTPEQYRLYELIYNRFISSQMTPAETQITTVDIRVDKYLFTASGSKITFDGFLAAYSKNDEEEEAISEAADKKQNVIPPLVVGEILDLINLLPSQHFTKPPPRYSDSSLVKALEEEGIGRPSTYAPIIHTLVLRDYVRREKGYFDPTELGCKVCDLLVEYFPDIMDLKFTATMEEGLDGIEEGHVKKLKLLKDFYTPFKERLDYAQKHIKKEVVLAGENCDKCGKPMIIKWGRKGKFLSCSDYPACKNSKSITSGVKCPEPACGGELIERRSRRGFFYGCSNYPKCTFTSKNLPEQKQG